jgi:hypothetical protein
MPCYHRSWLSALRGRAVGCHRVHNMPVTRQPCTPAPWIADLAAFRVLRNDYLRTVCVRARGVHHFCHGLLFVQTHPPVSLCMDDVLTTVSWTRCPRLREADTLASAWRDVRWHHTHYRTVSTSVPAACSVLRAPRSGEGHSPLLISVNCHARCCHACVTRRGAID